MVHLLTVLPLVLSAFGAYYITKRAAIEEQRPLADVETPKALGYRDDYEEYSSPDNVDKAWYEPNKGEACNTCGMDDKAIVLWNGFNGYFHTTHEACVWCRELICLTEHLTKFGKRDKSLDYLRDL